MKAEQIQATILNRALSQLYRSAVGARNFAYDHGIIASEKAALPVLSVGNLTVGGSGKSPFAQYLAAGLLERKSRPVILCRGYGGSLSGPHQVLGNEDVSAVGDEALMHAAHFGGRVPVVISRRRVLGAKLIFDRGLGDAIVLDDGFQHRELRRDADIVLIDPSAPQARAALERGLLLPAGVLRESPRAALRRATCVIYLERGEENTDLPRIRNLIRSECPVFRVRLKATSLIDIADGRPVDPAGFAGTTASVFSAIAYPERFLWSVANLGIAIGRVLSLPDHHLIEEPEWQTFAAKLPVVTTEKDAVKIRRFVRGPGQVFAVRLSADFPEERDEKNFWSLISDRIARSFR